MPSPLPRRSNFAADGLLSYAVSHENPILATLGLATSAEKVVGASLPNCGRIALTWPPIISLECSTDRQAKPSTADIFPANVTGFLAR
jgi:hypothetical protein